MFLLTTSTTSSIQAKTLLLPSTLLHCVVVTNDVAQDGANVQIGVTERTSSITNAFGDIVPPTIAFQKRDVRYISIYNASVESHDVQVIIKDTIGPTSTLIYRCKLEAKHRAEYNDDAGWLIYDANGIVQSKKKYSSDIEEIQMTGLLDGKTAYAFNLIGQRNGFTSSSVLNDVKEYDNGVARIADTNNSTLDIISSSANDDGSPQGTGVGQVKVVYIDNSNNLVESGAIVLNGTTLVTSVLTGVNQVLWMESLVVGSGGVADGNIRLRINGGTVEVEQITAGGNKSRSAVFMVPTGYTGYVVNWRVSAVNNDQDVRLRGQVNTLDRSIATNYHYISQKYAAINTNIPQHDIWMKIPALARVKASTMSGGTASTVRCNVNIFFIIIAD